MRPLLRNCRNGFLDLGAAHAVAGAPFGFADHAHKINSYRTSRAGIAETVRFVE